MFVQLDNHMIASETNLLKELLATSTLENGTGEETIWDRIKTLAQNFVDGVLRVAGIKTDELCVGSVCVDEADFLKMVQTANTAGTGFSENEDEDEDTPPPPPPDTSQEEESEGQDEGSGGIVEDTGTDSGGTGDEVAQEETEVIPEELVPTEEETEAPPAESEEIASEPVQEEVEPPVESPTV
jgi:hypothetical protein